MNTQAVICTVCGPLAWAESYARAEVIREHHHTLRNCWAYVAIKAYR